MLTTKESEEVFFSNETKLNGDHLILDGSGSDPQKLQDTKLIQDILHTLSDKLRMKKITEPTIARWTNEQTGEWGVSSYVMIAESHISIHTKPNKGTFGVDVFSCKSFDHGQVVAFFEDCFKPQVLIERSIDRSYPKDSH